MQAELKIKEILSSENSVDGKVRIMRKFMLWDEKKLKTAILKYGTFSKDGRASIIKEFWGGISKNTGRDRK